MSMNKAKLQIIKSRIASSGFFDEKFYAAQFDKRPEGDLLEYYILHGAEEDKDPSALFDNAYYMSQYEDVKSAGINPLYHYILHGRAEGRQAKKDEMRRISPEELKEMRKVISASGLFSDKYYASQFDERPEGDLLDRYILYGAYEDKDPSSFFDNSYYLDHNKDIKDAGLNPLYHYITHGKAEGRLPAAPSAKKKEADLYSEWVNRRKAQKGPALAFHELRDLYVIAKSGLFDGAWYLEQNPEVYEKLAKSAAWKWRFSNNKIKRTVGRFFSTAIRDYIKRGMYEDKDPNQDFSTSYYINHNPDLMAGRYMTPFAHYIEHGRAENRKGRDDSVVVFPWKSMIPLNTFADKKVKLSVITLNGAKYSGEAHEVISADNGIKAAIEVATGDVIWISDGGELPEDALEMFSMEMVYAVVCDGKLLKNHEKTALCSYREFGSKKHIIKGEVYEYSDILLRNPAKFSCFEETGEISSEEDYMLLMLRSVRGGAVGIVHGGSRRTSEDAGYYEGLAEILFRWYIDEPKKKAAFSDFRKAVVSSGVTDYTGFAGMFDAEKILRRSMNIMIGIYAFTFGGGEIMPIRLANALHRMGHNVTVHILLKNERDDKVRAMLSPEVPVVYGESKAAIAMYIANFGVQVYNSHHQAIQQRAAEALDAYPFIAKKILNIGTSHGMYENLARDSADYLFRESALMKVTDRWTYVANKNIKPFEEYNVYDPKIFKKIPNGMVRPETSPVDMAQFGISDESFTVCIVSRAKKEKGWLNAVNAVEKAREKTGRDIHLLLVGDGEVYDEYSKKLANDHIHFLGFRDNPCDYLAASDLCTLPSYYVSESAPLCLIEAMMCGKPCLATDIGDVRDMLTFEGELAGDVSPMENMTVDDEDLTNRLIRLVTDREAYDKAAETARKKSFTYEIDNVVKEYLSLYDDYYAKTGTEKTDAGKAQNGISRLFADAEKGTAPLVTVIVPNYNHEKFLPARLDCIFNQTYQNIEVLLMDDCSKDGSRELLKSYAEKYPDKARILFNEQNSGGVFYQWAKGIKNAKGSLCWIAESDDYCEEDFLENVLPAFEDEEVKLSYCKYCFVDEKDNRNENGFFGYVGSVDKQKWHRSYVNTADDEVQTALGIINSVPNASGAVFRNPGDNDVFDDKDWYKMKICGDWIFYLNIVKGGKIAYTVDTTSYFRFHSNNSSAKTYTNDTYYTEHDKVASCIRNLYHTDRTVIEKNHEKIRKFYHSHVEGTDEDFEKLYSVDEAMRFVYDRDIADKYIGRQKEKIAPHGDTIIIDPIISLPSHQDADTEQKLVYAGGNTGNMLFVKAVKDQLDHKDVIWYDGKKLAELEKNGATAVIPSSNFIIVGSDRVIDSIRPIYEGTTCNITMAGLGAQSYPPNDTPKKLVAALTDTKINFFRMAAERAVSLGVRGEFTAECLELMGIKNYRIIGCPTCFKYMDGIYREVKKPSANRTIFTVTGKNKGESGIVRFGMDNGSEMLMQMPTEMPQILNGGIPDDKMFEKALPALGHSKEEYMDFVKAHGHIFFDMDKWNEYMQEQDFTFSYGSRFHGNMSALLNGIPALWITHDSRTVELVDTLKLPHITLEEFGQIKSMEELIERCDYSEFYKAYEKMCAEYRLFLEENGLALK